MKAEIKTYLIFGISKGLGKAIAKCLPNENDEVLGISRSKPDYLHEKMNIKWISTDLSNPKKSSEIIKANVGDKKVDYFIYNVGIWESKAFTESYSFEENSESEYWKNQLYYGKVNDYNFILNQNQTPYIV